MGHFETLQKKIHDKEAKIAVIGIGYVGLPLSVAFAEGGFHVFGIDIDAKRVEKLQRGESDISDVPSSQLKPLVDSKKFIPTTDFDVLKDVDAISICVPTPLRKTREPDISYVVAATEQVVKRVRPGQLVILESTTYPGTTREIVVPRLEAKKLKTGEDLFVAFSPERVDPGNAKYGIKNTPKVVGGISARCTQLAAALYGSVIEKVVPVSSADSAELVKLLENTFRAVNIGLVNEIALVCDKLKIDVWEVIDAAASKPFGFMPFYPGPGLGGHCIPIDPHYLAWKLRALDYRVRFIELADDVNRGMPEYVVQKTSDALNKVRKAVNGSRLLILGMAYKKDVSDVRESPSLDIARLFKDRGAELSFYDPYVQNASIENWTIPSLKKLTPEELKKFDAVVIATNHSNFDYKMIAQNAALIVDARNATKGLESLGRIQKI